METVSHYQHNAATEEHLQYVTQAHYNGVPVCAPVCLSLDQGKVVYT